MGAKELTVAGYVVEAQQLISRDQSASQAATFSAVSGRERRSW